MEEKLGQSTAVLFKYEKLILLKKKLHPLVDVESPLRPFRALRQPIFMTVRRGAFFYRWKGVKEYESEIYLPRLWDTLGL